MKGKEPNDLDIILNLLEKNLIYVLLKEILMKLK